MYALFLLVYMNVGLLPEEFRAYPNVDSNNMFHVVTLQQGDRYATEDECHASAGKLGTRVHPIIGDGILAIDYRCLWVGEN